MEAMFEVRVPPSRVLLLLRRHVVVVRSASPRSDITAHSTWPPVPRCAVGMPTAFNQPIGDWDVSSVTTMYGMFCCTCPSILRAAAALALLCRARPLSLSPPPRSLLTPHGRPSLAAL